jgi:hypothetical protein
MTSTTNPSATGTPVASDQPVIIPDEDRVSGWIWFAGTILGLAGLMRIFDSIWAFGYHGSLPDGLRDGMFGTSLKNYAWVWLIVGIVLLVSSVLLLARSQFARWVGYFAAVVLTISAMAWMPYYPIWSITYVAIGVLTFYALAAHGGREAR